MCKRTMAISEFKANALRIIDEVSRTHETVLITRRGKPLAELTPYRKSAEKPLPGQLSKMLVHEEDIVSPIGESTWEAGK